MQKNLKFHWMLKDNINPSELSKLLLEINDIGYDSILLTFHSDEPDYIIRAAKAHIENQKTKFMFAVRPYAMDSRYLAMMLSAFDMIQKDNVYLNIIAGTSDNDAIKFDYHNSIEYRKELCADFAFKFRSHMKDFDLNTKIFFSGSSDKTVNNVNQYGDGIISLVSQINHSEKTNIARCWILIRDTDEEAEEEYTKLEGRAKDCCIYGNKDTVYNKLMSIDCDEFLISAANTDEDIIHSFIKDLLTSI